MPINFKLMGKRIKEFRLGKNLKQEELAWDAEMSASYLCSIENGKKRASLPAITRIADALNVTVDRLLSGEAGHGEFGELTAVLNGCDETEFGIIMDAVLGTAAALKRSLKEQKE